MHKTKHRIKSRIRFISFLVAVMLVSAAGFNLLLGTMDVRGETGETFVTVTVLDGDTLWNIAKEYLGDQMDIRVAVHRIIELNGITAEGLQPGQTLKIPV